MKVKFTTSLDNKLVDEIKLQALKEHRSVASILEEFIKSYVKNK